MLGNIVKTKEVRPWIGICDSLPGEMVVVKMIRPRMCFLDLVRSMVATLVLARREVNAPWQVVFVVVFYRRDACCAIVVNVRIVCQQIAWGEVEWAGD